MIEHDSVVALDIQHIRNCPVCFPTSYIETESKFNSNLSPQYHFVSIFIHFFDISSSFAWCHAVPWGAAVASALGPQLAAACHGAKRSWETSIKQEKSKVITLW